MTKQAVFTNALLDEIKVRVGRVCENLVRSTTAWLNVAHEFADGKTTFKTQQHAFEKFVIDTGFTQAVATKLVKIGRCKALYSEDVKDRISSVDGWTTLYEMAKLSDKRIKELLHDRSVPLSRAAVKSFALGNSPADNPIVLCTIEAAESTLQSLTETQIAEIVLKLKEAQHLFDSATARVKFNQHKKFKELKERSQELLERNRSAALAEAA